MRTDKIRNIGTESFMPYKEVIDYVDDDFIIINKLHNLPDVSEKVKLECLFIIVCDHGNLQMDINGKTYQIKENELIFILPSSIVSHTLLSPNYQIKLFGFSPKFLQRTVKLGKKSWNLFAYVKENPIMHFNKSEHGTFKLYRDLILQRVEHKLEFFHKEVIQHLLSALFFEIMNEVSKMIPQLAQTDNNKYGLTQSDHIFRRFINSVSADSGMHRSVSYFADILCYSPKHLSKVVKQVSGKTPLEIINSYTIEHIKHQLKHSDKSIKEISDYFNFSNPSFFGKYVKAQLGMSPKHYQDMQEE